MAPTFRISIIRMYDCRPVSTNAFQAQDFQLTFAPMMFACTCLVHYLYAYLSPTPSLALPHSTLLHVLSGRQRQRFSGPGLGPLTWRLASGCCDFATFTYPSSI